jgi:microcystin-dependent protein
MDPFIGEIKMVGFDFAPKGYAFCDGSMMSVAQNSALASLLKVTFGGDGVTSFALPDFRGRSPVGMGHSAPLSPVTLGERAGMESTTLSQANMPMHTHPVQTMNLHGIPEASTRGAGSNSPDGNILGGGEANIFNSALSADTTMTPIPITGQLTIGTVGGSLPLNLRNPYLGTNFVIAIYGIYPSHN